MKGGSFANEKNASMLAFFLYRGISDDRLN
jgi:hypothetical protein